MKFRKKDLLPHVINIVLFVLTWVFVHNRLFITGRIATSKDFFSACLVNPALGYNNLFQIVGVTFTILFVLSSARVLVLDNTCFLVKYNRDGFVKHKIKKMAINTALFVLEYIAVQVIFCIIFCKFSLLIELNFFICMLLLYVSLFEYFIIVGMSMLFFQYLFNFKNVYIVVPAIIFIGLAFFEYKFGIDIAPVYFSGFIGNFIELGIFDWLDYLVNIIETVIVFLILAIMSRIVFLKKDIIVDEKTEP